MKPANSMLIICAAMALVASIALLVWGPSYPQVLMIDRARTAPEATSRAQVLVIPGIAMLALGAGTLLGNFGLAQSAWEHAVHPLGRIGLIVSALCCIPSAGCLFFSAWEVSEMQYDNNASAPILIAGFAFLLLAQVLSLAIAIAGFTAAPPSESPIPAMVVLVTSYVSAAGVAVVCGLLWVTASGSLTALFAPGNDQIRASEVVEALDGALKAPLMFAVGLAVSAPLSVIGALLLPGPRQADPNVDSSAPTA